MNKLIMNVALIVLIACISSTASANNKEELKQTVALMLNLKGQLCATVVDIIPLKIKDQYEVTCIAYRDGKATKTYIFNAANGSSFEQ